MHYLKNLIYLLRHLNNYAEFKLFLSLNMRQWVSNNLVLSVVKDVPRPGFWLVCLHQLDLCLKLAKN